MARVNNQPSLVKVNAYRTGAGQPNAINPTAADPVTYCSNLYYTAVQRLATNKDTFLTYGSPDPNVATSLFAYTAQRFANAFAALDCEVT
jgi:hypothetical protein